MQTYKIANIFLYNQCSNFGYLIIDKLFFRKTHRYYLNLLSLSTACIISSSTYSLSAPECADNASSPNHSVYANGDITCYANHDYYTGLNTAHASGEGAKLIFTKDNVTIDGGATGGTAHTLAVGGSGASYVPGAAEIIINGNLTANNYASSNGRAIHIHHNTAGSGVNSLKIMGSLTIDHIGQSGAGIENGGGNLDVYGNTTVNTMEAIGIRARDNSISNYHGNVIVNNIAFGENSIRSTGGILNIFGNVTTDRNIYGIGIYAGGIVNVNGAANLKQKSTGVGILAKDNGIATFNSDIFINIDGDNANNSSLSSIGIQTEQGMVDIKEKSTINIDNANGSAIDANGGKIIMAGETTIRNISGLIPLGNGRAHGINIYNGAEIDFLDGADIYIDSENSSVIHMAEKLPNQADSTLYIKNGNLKSEKGDIADIKGGNINITLDKVDGLLSGTNTLLRASIGDTGILSNVNFNISDSNISGDVHIDVSSSANISLSSSTLTGTINNATNFLTDNTSSLFLTSNSTISDTLDNAGSVIFAATADQVFTTLNVGKYLGSGGTLLLRTVLGDDSSNTDMLFVEQGTNGSSKIKINNAGGAGAQTSDGIKIIDVDNPATSTGTFSLLGDYVFEGDQAVVGGAYAYRLYQGATSAPNDGSWYLRSSLIPTAPEVPLYQPGVPVYESYPQSLLGLNGLATLQQRVGNRYWAGNGNRVVSQGAGTIEYYAPAEEAGSYTDGNGVWGRIEGAHNKVDPKLSSSGTDYSQNVFKMQAGIDMLLNENMDGMLIGGVFAHYVHGKTKVRSIYGDGAISTNGYGFGGSLTWYGNEGFYVDGQAQATWYSSDLASTLAQTSLVSGNKGFGYALSLETGKRFAITPEWSLTPQAQLTYSNVDFDNFRDVWNTHVSIDKGSRFEGRLGLSLDHESSWQNAAGMTDRAHVYGIANLYYGFSEGTRVNVANTQFTQEQERLWGGLGVGGSYNWNDDKYSIYGEGLVKTSLNSFGDSYSLKGNVGFRVKW